MTWKLSMALGIEQALVVKKKLKTSGKKTDWNCRY